jgi:hypothetical protein
MRGGVMTNVLEYLLETAGDEQINKIMFFNFGYNRALIASLSHIDLWRAYDFHEVADSLDVEVDRGYGTPELPAIHAWTDNFVIATGVYDGASWFFRIAKDPETLIWNPDFKGGHRRPLMYIGSW